LVGLTEKNPDEVLVAIQYAHYALRVLAAKHVPGTDHSEPPSEECTSDRHGGIQIGEATRQECDWTVVYTGSELGRQRVQRDLCCR
jgi:hypothetical protein